MDSTSDRNPLIRKVYFAFEKSLTILPEALNLDNFLNIIFIKVPPIIIKLTNVLNIIKF